MKHKTITRTLLTILTRGTRTILVLAALGACFTTLALGAADSGPCSKNAESRQLDYWLGSWRVGMAGAPDGATSKVELSLDKCLVIESWEGGKGHAGKNMLGYSPDDKRWYGMFADNEGRVHVFTSGTVETGSAEFDGQSRGPDGTTVLNKVTVKRITPNEVEQKWEKSSDNGANWTTVFRGEYSRANP